MHQNFPDPIIGIVPERKSESVAVLASALIKAQANIGPATKGAENPFFKSSYADLGTVMSVCKQALLEQGIVVLQMVGRDEHGDYLETIILHESGEYIADRMSLVCSKQHDPQAMGSAITYARRYALQAALFIPSVDDDGEKAMAGIREDEQIGRRQEERERKATPKRMQPVKVSNPSDLDQVNLQLQGVKHGNSRSTADK